MYNIKSQWPSKIQNSYFTVSEAKQLVKYMHKPFQCGLNYFLGLVDLATCHLSSVEDGQ